MSLSRLIPVTGCLVLASAVVAGAQAPVASRTVGAAPQLDCIVLTVSAAGHTDTVTVCPPVL